MTLFEATYNSQHLPLSVTDASGKTSTATYNSSGQPTSITNALNQTTSIDYSTTGLLLRVSDHNPLHFTDFAYDAYDRVSSATVFPQGYTLRFEYDMLDRPTRVIYPDDSYEEQVWDKLNAVASRDRAGQWTQMRYSLLGQLQTLTNPAGETIQYDWCRCGSLSRLVDAEGRISAWYRDLQGRLTKKELPDLSAETYEYMSGELDEQAKLAVVGTPAETLSEAD